MKQEFEIVTHSGTNLNIFLVEMLYRAPHIHKDFEIGYVLDGKVEIFTQNQSLCLEQGSFWIMNPIQGHELKADNPALLLSAQVSPAFFASYYPQIENLEFHSFSINPEGNSSSYNPLRKAFHQLALEYFRKSPFYQLKCASLLNEVFQHLIQSLEYRFVTEQERLSLRSRAKRIRTITNYIDTHYTEKLLLSDIARQEQLSLSYLSHFFKDCFGIPFQDYLLRIRCENARRLLLLTDLSLLDICIACGFSDSKYFNSGFRRQYGLSPKEFRKQFQKDAGQKKEDSGVAAQEILGAEESLRVLERLTSATKPASTCRPHQLQTMHSGMVRF